MTSRIVRLFLCSTICALTCHVVPAASERPADPIVGKWRFFNNTTRSFLADGSSTNEQGAQDATWKFAGTTRGGFRKYLITYGGKFVDTLDLKDGDNVLTGAKNFKTASRLQTAPPAAPPKPPAAPVAPPAPTNAAKDEMALAPDWMPTKVMTSQEMLRALAFYSLAAVDGAELGKEAVPGKILWDLEWLMPLAEAEKKLQGVQRVQRDYQLQNPCFPQGSIFVKCFFGDFVDPNSLERFKEANLICDMKRQLISVELVHNHPHRGLVAWEERQPHWWTGEPWMDTPKDVELKDLPALTGKKVMPGPDGRREPYYDFISLKNNASTTQQVWYQVRHAGTGVTSIHTVLLKGRAYPVIAGEVIENVRWYLTAPFARKLLDIAKANKPASSPAR